MTEQHTKDDDVKAFDEGDFDLTKLRYANVRVGREPKSSLAIRFDVDDIERLRQVAENEGVGVTQLVRSWVLERLNEPEPSQKFDALKALEAVMDKLKASTRSSSTPRG